MWKRHLKIVWGRAFGNHQDGANCFIALWLCVGWEGLERGWCYCLASGGLPRTHTISSQFTHSLYVTGTLPAVALVVNPRVGWFTYVLRLCGPFKQSLLKIWQFLPLPKPLLDFTASSYQHLSFWHWNSGLWGLAWDWDCLLPRYPS